MTITLVFLAGLAAIAAWWLARHGLADRPWLETGPMDGTVGSGGSPLPAAKLGLGLFIAVASTLMVLLVSAYSMRMEMRDWNPPPQPVLLWVNTGVLVLASIVLHRAMLAARRRDRQRVKAGLLGAGVTGTAFLLGQILAWRELAASGYLPAANPADAFFYLITAAHGLHVVGGLVALGRTALRLQDGICTDRLRLGVELSAIYWHFLLLAWIFLFSVLAFSPSLAWLYAICTAPFS